MNTYIMENLIETLNASLQSYWTLPLLFVTTFYGIYEQLMRNSIEREASDLIKSLKKHKQKLAGIQDMVMRLEESRQELAAELAQEVGKRMLAESRLKLYRDLEDDSWLKMREAVSSGFAETVPLPFLDTIPMTPLMH